MRGKLGKSANVGLRNRITPACAGKTNRGKRLPLFPQDHPRVCGENAAYFVKFLSPGGSPPRVRGKPAQEQLAAASSRITPACAGKTISVNDDEPASRDHPRVCGENFTRMSCTKISTGSPPRVRGKLDDIIADPDLGRITPACAGKTPGIFHKKRTLEDHPRVCGENLFTSTWSVRTSGSPPRVRGKLMSSGGTLSGVRITPACAGKTTPRALHWRRKEDHPRVCGENLPRLPPGRPRGGSPPRVRGKPGDTPRRRLSPRITPACAGKTCVVGCY